MMTARSAAAGCNPAIYEGQATFVCFRNSPFACGNVPQLLVGEGPCLHSQSLVAWPIGFRHSLVCCHCGQICSFWPTSFLFSWPCLSPKHGMACVQSRVD